MLVCTSISLELIHFGAFHLSSCLCHVYYGVDGCIPATRHSWLHILWQSISQSSMADGVSNHIPDLGWNPLDSVCFMHRRGHVLISKICQRVRFAHFNIHFEQALKSRWCPDTLFFFWVFHGYCCRCALLDSSHISCNESCLLDLCFLARV